MVGIEGKRDGVEEGRKRSGKGRLGKGKERGWREGKG